VNWGEVRARILMVGGSQLLQKLVGFLVIALMTRHLARDQMGEFFLAAAIGLVAAQATELGTTRHLIRSIARDRPQALLHLGRVVSMRLPAMLLSFTVVNSACLLVKPSLSHTLLLVSFYLLLQDLQGSFNAFFVGHEHFGFRTMLEVMGQVLLAISTLVLVAGGGGLHTILLAYVIAYASVLLVTVTIIRTRYGPFRLRWDLKELTGVARLSLPILAVTLLDTVHFKADTMMMGFLRPLSDVAAYEAAYRLFEVSRVVVRPVSLIFYPVCVTLAAKHDWPELERVFRRLTRTSLGVGVVVTSGVLAAAGLIVPLVFGPKYTDSIPLVRVLFLTSPMLFTGLLAVLLVHTLHQERLAIRAALGCIVANVSLNLMVIPRWGPLGAAWVTCVTQTLWTAWLVRVVYRQLRDARLSSPGAADSAEPSAASLSAQIEEALPDVG
jgi:O-antigen/teichoic acid export membrane protein